jgi:hypothetical protein
VRTALAAAGAALVALAGACGGDDDGGGGDRSPLMAVLSAIPDTPETAAYVSFADLEEYFDALGVGSPPAGASNDEMNDWLTGVAEAERSGDYGRLVSGSQFAIDAFREPEAFRAEIGLDPADVGQSAETGEPPGTLHVLRGGFDAGDIDDAVHGDSGFSDLLEEAEHGGVSYYAWGEDFEQDFSRNSPVHTLGRGGRLALTDGLLFWCFGTEALTGAIDAMTGEAPSLADREDFAAIAPRSTATAPTPRSSTPTWTRC